MKKLVSILVILLSFTLLVGCGGDEAKVKSTAKKVTKAMKKGDFDTLVKYASKKEREEYKKTKKSASKEEKKMMKEMEKKFKEEFKGAKFTYGDPEIDGDKATIKVTMTKDGKDKDSQKMKFIKEDGKWVMKSFRF